MISENIAHLIRRGHKPDQAAAIAYDNCRRGKYYGGQRSISWLERKIKGWHLEPGAMVYRAADGLRRMVLVSSNSYRDREREWLSSDALQEYVNKSWLGPELFVTDNTAFLWHEDDEKPNPKPLGPIVWADMEGPFLVEVVKELANTVVWHKGDAYPGSILWDYIESTPEEKWGASVGFAVELKEVNAKEGETTFKQIRKVETSVLPLRYAANPYTFAGIAR